MPEAAQSVSTKGTASFANLIASFADKFRDDDWDDSALANDVSTITYEQALRAGRPGRIDRPATSGLLNDSGSAISKPEAVNSQTSGAIRAKKQRSGSITIRVTSEEQAQLHERATAADLSVSAYLRSCIFEAEALRTQVKEALAQMQSTTLQTHSSTIGEKRRGGLPWRFLKRWLHRNNTEN